MPSVASKPYFLHLKKSCNEFTNVATMMLCAFLVSMSLNNGTVYQNNVHGIMQIGKQQYDGSQLSFIYMNYQKLSNVYNLYCAMRQCSEIFKIE